MNNENGNRLLDKYYSIKDIEQLTGKSYSMSAKIVRDYNELYHKEYPQATVFQGQILKSFFDEKFGFKEEINSEEN